jgi:hypothetical protein
VNKSEKMPSSPEIHLNTDVSVRFGRGTGLKSQFHKSSFSKMFKTSDFAVCSTFISRRPGKGVLGGIHSFLGDFQDSTLGICPDPVIP